jgi:hypothetical protein
MPIAIARMKSRLTNSLEVLFITEFNLVYRLYLKHHRMLLVTGF